MNRFNRNPKYVKSRFCIRAWTIAIFSLLVSIGTTIPVHADYEYTAPIYDAWVQVGMGGNGTFNDAGTAAQTFTNPSSGPCYPTALPPFCYVYSDSKIGPNLWQWDSYWKIVPSTDPSPKKFFGVVPLLSCPSSYRLGAYISPSTGSSLAGDAWPGYTPVLFGYASSGYAFCFRKSDSGEPSLDQAPGPPLGGSPSHGGSCKSGDTSAIGNPCDAATGNKYEHDIDHRGDSASSLRLERYYNSVTAPAGQFGTKWRSNFDRRVIALDVKTQKKYQFPDDDTMNLLQMDVPFTRSVKLERPDGKSYWFTQQGYAPWRSELSIDGTLSSTPTGWTYSTPDGITETYNGSGRLISITDRNGQILTLTSNTTGNLRVTDAFGRSLFLSFDQVGNIQAFTDPAGRITRYGYDGNGNLTRVDYPDGTAKLYHYEDTRFPGHLTGISHSSSSGTTTRYSSYGYNDKGLASSTEHAGGIGRFTLNYDNVWQTTVTDAIGSQERLTFVVRSGAKLLSSRSYASGGGRLDRQYDSFGRVTCHGDRDGRATKYTYAGRLISSKTEGLSGGTYCGISADTVPRITTFQYLSPSLDLPTVIESPSVFSGNMARITIGYSGNLPTSITQSGYAPSGTAVNRSLTLGYNAYGQVITIDGPRTDVNDITQLTYYECTSGGACGQLRSITNALGQASTFDSYNGAGQLLEMTDANGLKTSYTYDARGRVSFITQVPVSGNPRSSEYRYTAAGDVAYVALPDGRTLTYEYNAARLLTAISDNFGNRVSYGYDLKGNRTQTNTYDSSGTLTRAIDVSYEARNNISQINSGGSITKFITDAVGNVTTEFDPNTTAVNGSTSTRNTYDRMSRLITSINKVYGYTYYAYDINSNLKQVKTPNSATTTYAYDDLGNLLTEISPDRGTMNYAYDAAGNLTQQTDARGIVSSYTYDALNRLTRVDYPGSAEDVTYTYDAGTGCTFGLGRPCAVADESGTTAFAYDGFGNMLSQVHTELGVAYTTRYTYDAGNRVIGITYPNGRQVNFTRNVLGNILSASMTLYGVTTPLVTGGSYRPDGLPTNRSFGNNLTDTRAYDTQGRLRELYLGSADTRLFSYDANGNLTGLQSLPQVGVYQYDALDRLKKEDRTTQATTTTNWTYDANGNRKTQNTGSYAYLANSNRLTTAAGSAINLDAAGNTLYDGTRSYTYNNAGQLSQVGSSGYSYNAQRQRSRKIAGSQATVYHYDLAGNLIAETDADGNLLRDYVWADSIPIAQVEAGEKIAYLHTDHLNTPRLATNPQGQVVWRWEGTAFGETYPNEDVDGNSIKTTINLRFPGQYYDVESGLHYNWNRYYDPKIGRYVTSDPIGLRGGFNTYAYVGGNPVNAIDPLGLAWVGIWEGGEVGQPGRKDAWVVVLGGRNNWFSVYRGSSLPGNPKKCATVASGSYDFKAEMNSRYPGSPVLRIGDPGGNVPVVGGKNPNPDSTAPAGYANGVLMHKAFENRDGTTGSCGCMGVETNDWSRFSGQFNVDDTGTVKIFR